MRRLSLFALTTVLFVLALPALAFAQDGPTTAELSLAMDTMWVIVAAVLVIFMQAGFAMLEVGFSRMKNVGSVVAKILVNLAIAALLFWAVGFAITFGTGNAIMGTQGWFLAVPEGQVNAVYAGLSWTQVPLSAKFLFQVAFCAVSLAIVWGTMLERTKFAVYVIFAVIFAGLIYPLIGHWIWGGGWLTELGMQDFAGSTVVHLSGAMAALAGTLLLGPRLGKYDDEGRPMAIPGHNMPLAVLGVLILWIGWYGFNPGSTMAASTQIADIALTTTLAAAAGVLGAMLMSYFYRGNVDVGMGGNGAIAALVGITAPCAFVAPWASIVIGLVAGVIMYATLVYVDRIGVDDPLGRDRGPRHGRHLGHALVRPVHNPGTRRHRPARPVLRRRLLPARHPGPRHPGLRRLRLRSLPRRLRGLEGHHRHPGEARPGARRPRYSRARGLRIRRATRRHRSPERKRPHQPGPPGSYPGRGHGLERLNEVPCRPGLLTPAGDKGTPRG